MPKTLSPRAARSGLVLALALALVGAVTPQADASSSRAYSAYVDLPIQMGDTGSEVSTVQAMLKSAGYDPGPIDGAFGPLTERAIVALQEDHDLPLTGKVDQAVWDILTGSFSIVRGARGNDVRSLQQRLADAGFNPGPIDGIFGSLTEQALRQFQSANGLSDSGSVDQATWDALESDPGVTAVTLRRGDRGGAVRNLQLLLASAGINPGPIDGIFGGLTESAVSSYQSANGFSATGTVTPDLLDHLDDNAPEQDALLQNGDRGDEVEAIQESLYLVGFNPGPIDGIFGSGTERAVRRFQGVFGLPGDGIVGQRTLDKINELEPLAQQAYDYGWNGGSGSEQWRSLVTEVFTTWGLHEEVCVGDTCIGPQIENALMIMTCESNGNATVVNWRSGTTGLFQHRPAFWDARTARVRDHFPDFRTNATPYNPEDNVMVAALLVWESREALLGNSSRSGPWDDGPEPWGHWDGSSRDCAGIVDP